jgi:O-antigen ligase
MPPPLAAFLTLGFIVFLYRRDMRTKPNVTGAIWVPFIWIFLCCSRGASEWIYTLTGRAVGGTLEEGSPVDRAVWIALIGAGIYILRQRQVRLGELVRNNRWLAAFLIYCFLAIFWSEFPFVALKRWIKVLGNPIMVLVIMTEPDPKAAFMTVMKRCAYIVLPVSILFIKYFPQYGRGFSVWTGAPLNTGITLSKNILGVDCLIFGFFFVWYILNVRMQRRTRWRRDELLLCTGFLLMTWWLFRRADSQTPMTAFLVGVAMMLLTGSKLINKRMLGTYIVIGLVTFLFLEALFDIYSVTLRLLGRDATLTDRTLLWADLLREPINPFLGAGFESFWLGERIRRIWEKWTFGPNQAHNGYIETYLNLGLIGLSLLVALILATYDKARRALIAGAEFGRFRLGFLVSIIFYNWTEAAFKTTHIVFLMFYVISLDLPRRRSKPGAPLRETAPPVPETALKAA